MSPVYPSLHPVSHAPVDVLHGAPSRQCLLQLYLHPGPYFPAKQASKMEENNHYQLLNLPIIVE